MEIRMIPLGTQNRCSEDPSLKRKLDCALKINRIFVGDLPVTTKHYDLQDYFSAFGVVIDVNLLRPTEEQTPRRCAFVSFRDWDSVRKALAFQPHVLKGTRVTVSLPRTKRMRYTRPEHSTDQCFDRAVTGPHKQAVARLAKGASMCACNPTKIFVGRLNPKTTECDLRVYFSGYGIVSMVQIITNRQNSISGNFGFVTFADSRAIGRDVLKIRHFLHGRYLNVKAARPPEQSRVVEGNLPIQSTGRLQTLERIGPRFRRPDFHHRQQQMSPKRVPSDQTRRTVRF
nr:unnamed protein product [Spirometra erinaceieuropaei]